MSFCRCPYNDVASFVYRYRNDKNNNSNCKVLELGSGDGNNLWYLKKEGFDVKGIELNESRIKNSIERLKEDDLDVEIKKCSFTKIPYDADSFNLVFDRAAITCVNYEDAKKTINEVYRVLKKGGNFYFNPYSELDDSLINGIITEDGRVTNINNSYGNYDGVSFYSIKEALNLFDKDKWKIIEFNLLSKKEIIVSRNLNTTTFEIIVEKL